MQEGYQRQTGGSTTALVTNLSYWQYYPSSKCVWDAGGTSSNSNLYLTPAVRLTPGAAARWKDRWRYFIHIRQSLYVPMVTAALPFFLCGKRSAEKTPAGCRPVPILVLRRQLFFGLSLAHRTIAAGPPPHTNGCSGTSSESRNTNRSHPGTHREIPRNRSSHPHLNRFRCHHQATSTAYRDHFRAKSSDTGRTLPFLR